MCGIVGIATNNTKVDMDEEKAFEQMLVADTFRGVHSTGVFGVGPNTHAQAKKAMPAWDFVQLKQYIEWARSFRQFEAVIGHNRAATQGKVNTANAHPFTHGHITGVHNGTLRNHRQLTGGNKFDVDSEALIYSIMKDGYIDALEKVEGAYAIVWWDHKDYKLRMTRNEERPLYFGFVKGRNTMLYASESGLLHWVAERNGLHIESTFYVKPGTVLTFDMANLRDYSLEEFTIKRTPVNYGTNYKGNSKPGWGNTAPAGLHKRISVAPFYFSPQSQNSDKGTVVAQCIDGSTTEDIKIYNVHKNTYAEAYEEDKYMTVYTNGSIIDNTKRFLLASESSIKIEEFEQSTFYYGPNKELLTKEQFQKAVEDGCAMCSGNIFLSDDTKMMWMDRQSPVCPQCAKAFAGASA